MKDACLVIDTTNQWTIVSLLNSQEREAVGRSCIEAQSSFRLLTAAIQELLAEKSLSRPAWIAVALGPGSFTGIRIGVGTARNLAQLWDIPARGVGSLRYYCYDLRYDQRYDRNRGGAAPEGVAVMIDARRSRVYAAYMKEGKLKKLMESSAEKFLEELPPKTAIYADRAEIIRSYLPKEMSSQVRIESMRPPRAEQLYRLACLDGGPDRQAKWQNLTPVYLRQDPAHERYPQGLRRSHRQSIDKHRQA